MNKSIIDALIQKAKTYPKVESYLRGLDKRRIDEGEDVPVTKREKMVRAADEASAKKAEARKSNGRPEAIRDLERMAGAEYRFRQNNPEDTTIPDSLKTDFDKENIMAAKSFDDKTVEYFVKCHSHVLFGETEDSLKAKKKQPKKADGHVLGGGHEDEVNHPGGEMVVKKEPDAYKSEESDLVKAVDALLEKAVYGAGARGGKVERGSHKDTPSHSKGSSVSISPERAKEIEERSKKKIATRAAMTGMHATAAKFKSIDDRTIDYIEKATRQTSEGGDDPRKEENPEEWKRIGDRNAAMHAGLKPKVPKGVEPRGEEVVETKKEWEPETKREAAGINRLLNRKSLDEQDLQKMYTGGSPGHNPNQGRPSHQELVEHAKKTGRPKPKAESTKPEKPAMKRYPYGKSIDERTIDLVKALTSDREKEIHSAASLVRLAREGMHKEAGEIKAKPEDVVRVARTHNNIIAARTQKSICDKWQDSPFITKGARVMPVGPGGQVQDLSKDDSEDDDNGAE